MRLHLNKLIKVNPYALVAFLMLICLYYVFTEHIRLVDEFFLPSLKTLGDAFLKMFGKENFLLDIGYSTARVWVSYLIAFVLWVPIALLISHSKRVRKTILPYVDFLRYIPVPTLIPLSILFFGIGEMSKIFLLLMWTVFQLILLVLNDLDSIPKAYYYLSHSLWWQWWKTLVLRIRAISPQLYDNSRIMIGWCWTYVVIAELVAAQHGVGFVIKEAQRFANTPKIYIAIIAMWVVGFLTDLALRKLRPLLFRYEEW